MKHYLNYNEWELIVFHSKEMNKIIWVKTFSFYISIYFGWLAHHQVFYRDCITSLLIYSISFKVRAGMSAEKRKPYRKYKSQKQTLSTIQKSKANPTIQLSKIFNHIRRPGLVFIGFHMKVFYNSLSTKIEIIHTHSEDMTHLSGI